jgi:plasmid stabilization system protein ParE
MKVRLTQEAQVDLERIGDYLAQYNPQRAIGFVRELREPCLSLADRPLAFALIPRHETFGVHRRVHGNCLIFYRVEAAQVVILHVLHGATDYEPLLFSVSLT